MIAFVIYLFFLLLLAGSLLHTGHGAALYQLPTTVRLANHSLPGVYAAVLPARWTPPMLDVTASTCLAPAATPSSAHLDLKNISINPSYVRVFVCLFVCPSLRPPRITEAYISAVHIAALMHACMYVGKIAMHHVQDQ